MLNDRKGNIIWSGLGVRKAEKKGNTIYFNDPKDQESLSNNTIYSLLENSKGNIWAGAAFKGLNKLHVNEKGNLISKRFIPHPTDNSLRIIGDLINPVYSDFKKNIWVVTDNGLSKISEGKEVIKKKYSSKNGLRFKYPGLK